MKYFIGLNCDYTFQNYLVGDNNKDAVAAISSAMALPGQIHNPLFIYGPTGVGKTHLLQALAHEYSSASKLYYTTIDDLVNDIIHACQAYYPCNSTPSPCRLYRTLYVS